MVITAIVRPLPLVAPYLPISRYVVLCSASGRQGAPGSGIMRSYLTSLPLGPGASWLGRRGAPIAVSVLMLGPPAHDLGETESVGSVLDRV